MTPRRALPDIDDLLHQLDDCACCPRLCQARRTAGELGYCRADAGFSVAAVCLHRGEEPVISGRRGICNVFFARCNLQCLYCQNRDISRRDLPSAAYRLTFGDLVERIESVLDQGARAVGFVSPSHVIPQMTMLIRALSSRQPRPVFVMNTNAYDRVDTLRPLESAMDVYLPDLKYMDGDLARRYSDAADYPEVAGRALREMHRQKGSSIRVDDDGNIEFGLIVRHLVLPGQVENSKQCLRFIADMLSPDVHISLMAQYGATPAVQGHPELGRRLRAEEYEQVVEELHRLGFSRGWTQELASHDYYRPDFDRLHPFE